jgi:hypothetical protein
LLIVLAHQAPHSPILPGSPTVLITVPFLLLSPWKNRRRLFPPGAGEPNTITDFNGFVGVANIDGAGAGDHADLSFDIDNRFITGEYIALDGRHLEATFGFL